MKTALFVDFDNAYLGLERLSFEVAARFGQNPRQWLRWLSEEFPCGCVENGEDPTHRRVLIRRCYLNPVTFSRFRRPFLEAGFDVVDCPPMTAAGKTSTDVHMVLDMVDALQHPTGFDEFVVFSADADFSPVLRRLRTNNRKTVVFAAGNMSQAYRASADVHIDVDTFIYDGLGHPRPSSEISNSAEPVLLQVRTQSDTEALRGKIAAFIVQIVQTASEPVPMAKLAAEVNRSFGNLAASKWLDAGTFSDFFVSLNLGGIEIDRANQLVIDLARRNRQEDNMPIFNDDPVPNDEDIISGAIATIQEEVSRSAIPVKYVRMASILDKKFASLRLSNWQGHRTFSGFVGNLNLGELRLTLLPDSADRVIYDPKRHVIDQGIITNPLVASIFHAAKLPQVTASDFCSILNVFWACYENQPFDISVSSNKTYLMCAKMERSAAISLSIVTSLLQGLIFDGFDPRRNYDTPDELKIDVCGFVLASWAQENLVPFVDNDTRIQFKDWVTNGEQDAIHLDRGAAISPESSTF